MWQYRKRPNHAGRQSKDWGSLPRREGTGAGEFLNTSISSGSRAKWLNYRRRELLRVAKISSERRRRRSLDKWFCRGRIIHRSRQANARYKSRRHGTNGQSVRAGRARYVIGGISAVAAIYKLVGIARCRPSCDPQRGRVSAHRRHGTLEAGRSADLSCSTPTRSTISRHPAHLGAVSARRGRESRAAGPLMFVRRVV